MPDHFWCQPQVYLDGLELRAPSSVALALEPIFKEHERVVRSPVHDALPVLRMDGREYAGTTLVPPPAGKTKSWGRIGYYISQLDHSASQLQLRVEPHVKSRRKPVRLPYRDALPVRRSPGTDSLLPLRPE